MKIQNAPLCMLVLALAGCGGTVTPPEEYPPAPETQVTEAAAVPETAPEVEPPAPPPVTLVAGEHTSIEGAAPSMRVTAMRGRDQGKFRVALTNWSLGADPGNHVHVIVDNEPYIAVRDVSQPLDVAALVRDNLHHELSPGRHVVRMFPSRPHHESVKVDGNFFVAEFTNGRGESDVRVDTRAPLLTYSRPKGCYAAGSRILLDFYLTNVPNFGTHHRVAVSVDGNDLGEITQWTPHFLENLPVGEHDVRLRLMGAGGLVIPEGMRATEAVAGPFNDTTRRISVAESCGGTAPASPHGQH